MNAIIQGFMWGLGMIGADRVINSGVIQTKAQKFWDDMKYVADGKHKKSEPAVVGQVVDFKTGKVIDKGVAANG